MTFKHGFEVPADVYIDLPRCDFVNPDVQVDTFGSAYQQDYIKCMTKATLFYLYDGGPCCRCVSHPLEDPEHWHELEEINWDEYQVAKVHLS